MEHQLENFPRELAHKIQEGRQAGLTDDQLREGIVHLTDMLSKFIKPDSPEEALIKAMWGVSTDEEKRTIANIMLRLGDQWASPKNVQ
ncbi:DUF3243 family protein [Desulforudis sp. 1088]|uniref:DUF3243 family protein n=1 Tax=unclassified Candidatus Desulforudis TaxID=2635950 RepID=UPI0034734818